MVIVEPYAKLKLGSREEGIALLRKIERIGRISHRSEDAQNSETWERFIRTVVLGHGDWSIVEHCSVSVDFLVDRGITHEIVRHRLASYTQESTRFVNYAKKIGLQFIEPAALGEAVLTWKQGCEDAEMAYLSLLDRGVSPQIARDMLPNCLASRLIATANVRSWRHFLLMRTTKEAHPKMRQVTISLLADFQAKIPLLFDDIEPFARQADNLKKAR